MYIFNPIKTREVGGRNPTYYEVGHQQMPMNQPKYMIYSQYTINVLHYALCTSATFKSPAVLGLITRYFFEWKVPKQKASIEFSDDAI